MRALALTKASVSSALAMVLMLAACGFPADDSAEPIARDDLPPGLQPDATSPVTDAVETVEVTVWFVRDDRLVPARHDVARPVSVSDVAATLLAGPSDDESGQGLRSALPTDDVVDLVTQERGTALVDLSASFSEIPASDQLFAVGQLVLTLTDSPGVGTVEFVDGGSALAVPLPSGETTDEPLYRELYAPLRES